MATTINVKIAPLPRGEWDNGTAYAKLDAVSYNGSSYMAIKATPAGTLPTNTTYWQVLAEQPTIADGSITTNKIADGAVTNGKLADSSVDSAKIGTNADYIEVGTAKGLLSEKYTEDSVPYVFRKTPTGSRVEEDIVGGSVAWNQLINYSTGTTSTISGVTFTKNTDGKWTVTNTASAVALKNVHGGTIDFLANHKYFLRGCPSGGTESGYRLDARDSNNTVVGTSNEYGNGVLFTTTTDKLGGRICIRVGNGTAMSGQVFTPQLFDLTQMFGLTVADYIYSLETNHTGDGVAFFRAMFPKSYYAYNTGELVHVKTTGKKTSTGKNLFDKSNYESVGTNSYINRSGLVIAGTVEKTFCMFLPQGTYSIQKANANGTARLAVTQFADKPTVGATGTNILYLDANPMKGSFTLPYNSWVAVWFYNGSGADVSLSSCLDTVMIETGSVVSTYEAYSSPHTYPLSSGVLRGVPKLVSNKLKFDGDIYASDGTVKRRYGIVTYDGSNDETISVGTVGTTITRITISHSGAKYPNPQQVSSYLPLLVEFSSETEHFYDNGNQTLLFILSSKCGTTVASVRTYLSSNPITVVYELATPTTESATPYILPQIVSPYGTEEYICTEQSGVSVPVGHDSKYYDDLVGKLDGLPWNFSSLIAPTEVTNKASQNYAVGSYLIMNNTLYKVTSAIASGGTITPNTNCVATTIMAEILSL